VIPTRRAAHGTSLRERSPDAGRLGVVLIGHGAPATDCPPQLIGELMSLQWRAGNGGAGHRGPDGQAAARPDERDRRATELDAKIRNWPRTRANDPYKAGLERLARALGPLLPTGRFAIGYNEFCRPTIAEAVAQVIGKGARRVLVIPTMMTPGGVHSELDVPQALEGARQAHPGVSIEYLWPFDLSEVAGLLARHIRRAASATRRAVGGRRAAVLK
jgi:sirohydrochlorin cobaltochelatase